MFSFTHLFLTKIKVKIKNNMTITEILIRKKLWVITLLIFIGLAASSCHRARYRKMIRKRRTGHIKKKSHRSKYQKKLRKKTISTSSKYYIKRQKRNYRRKPWYDK